MFYHKQQDRADKLIAQAQSTGQLVLTVNGVLCPACAASANPANVISVVSIDSGEGNCYNCNPNLNRK